MLLEDESCDISHRTAKQLTGRRNVTKRLGVVLQYQTTTGVLEHGFPKLHGAIRCGAHGSDRLFAHQILHGKISFFVFNIQAVRNQRMQSIDGGKLFGQTKGHSVIDRLFVRQSQNGRHKGRQSQGRGQTGPVGIHGQFDRLGLEQFNGPVDGVNLGFYRRDTQTRHAKQSFVVQFRMVGGNLVGNGIVFLDKEFLQQRDTGPAVLVVSRRVDAFFRFRERVGIGGIDVQSASLETPGPVHIFLGVAVHKGGIPPLRPKSVVLGVFLAFERFAKFERVEGTAEFFAAVELHASSLCFIVKMADPVVYHGLNPRRGNHVELRKGCVKLVVAREQFGGDFLRRGILFYVAEIFWYGGAVASKGRSRGSRVGVHHVGTKAPGGARLGDGDNQRIATGIDGGGKEIVGPQQDAVHHQGGEAKWSRPVVPFGQQVLKDPVPYAANKEYGGAFRHGTE